MSVGAGNFITITLDKNGGSGGTSSLEVVAECLPENYPDITTPSRGSFRFDGYYTTRTGGYERINDEGTPQVIAPSSSTTWYAHWYNAIDYNVSGTFTVTQSSSSQSVTITNTAGTCATGSLTYVIETLKKNGTVTSSTGWSISSNGKTITVPANQAVGTYTVELSVSSTGTTSGTSTYFAETVYPTVTIVVNAQQTITITLNGNGGSGNQSSIQVTPGAAAGAWSVGTLPTRSGFDFLGYYSASTSGTQYTSPTGETNHTAPTSATTLYANWRPIVSYTLLDDPVIYCTTQAASYNTADGNRVLTISTSGVSAPSGVSYTVSESYTDWTISSNGKTITIPSGTVADEYSLMILIDVPAGSNYRSRYDQYDGECRLVEVTKYPNDTNPTKYKNTSFI